MAALRTALVQSKGRAARSEFGRKRSASQRLRRPKGTLTAKSQGHGPTARMPAASEGATAAESETTRPLRPMPRPRWA